MEVRVTASDDQILRQLLLYVDGALVRLLTAPPPLSAIDPSSQLNYTLLASDLLDGDHNILAKAVDAAGNISTTTPVTFSSSNPIANFTVTPSLVRPGLSSGTHVAITGTLQKEADWTLTFYGPSPVDAISGHDRQINEMVNVGGLKDGEYSVKITAEGVLEKPSARFTIDLITGPTMAEITNLSEGQVLRDGLYNLEGTADDPDSTDEVFYKLTLHHLDGSLVRDITPHPVNASGFYENRVPANGRLGEADFTMVRNGVYDLRLTVKGGTDTKTAQVRFCLESNLKVGQFSFSQQDLLIPVAGQPLAVIRTYNSLNPDAGDFGHSWTWSITDIDMELDEERGKVESVDGQFFSQRLGGGRNVTLTLPDGRRTTFLFSLEGAGRFKHRAQWTAPPGVQVTLEAFGSTELITFAGGLQYWQASGPDTPVDSYDFPGFILTMENGAEYLIEREATGEFFVLDNTGADYYVETYGEGTLRRITQRSGDRVEFNRNTRGDVNQIDHFSATNVKTKSHRLPTQFPGPNYRDL